MDYTVAFLQFIQNTKTSGMSSKK